MDVINLEGRTRASALYALRRAARIPRREKLPIARIEHMLADPPLRRQLVTLADGRRYQLEYKDRRCLPRPHLRKRRRKRRKAKSPV